MDLVIDSGQDAQRIVPAKVLRANAGLDLAELQAQGDGPYKSMTLGKIDGLVET